MSREEKLAVKAWELRFGEPPKRVEWATDEQGWSMKVAKAVINNEPLPEMLKGTPTPEWYREELLEGEL